MIIALSLFGALTMTVIHWLVLVGFGASAKEKTDSEIIGVFLISLAIWVPATGLFMMAGYSLSAG